MLGAFDPELNDHSHAANIRKAIRLIAKVSTLITDGYRIAHNEDPLPERENLDDGRKFLYKLRGEVPRGLADPDAGHDFYFVCRS
jgi:Citrate synthase